MSGGDKRKKGDFHNTAHRLFFAAFIYRQQSRGEFCIAIMAVLKKLRCFMLLVGFIGVKADMGERPLKSAREVGFHQHWGELSERERLAKRYS